MMVGDGGNVNETDCCCVKYLFIHVFLFSFR